VYVTLVEQHQGDAGIGLMPNQRDELSDSLGNLHMDGDGGTLSSFATRLVSSHDCAEAPLRTPNNGAESTSRSAPL